MKRTISVFLVTILIFCILSFVSCGVYKEQKNVEKIESIIKTGMLVNNGKYFIGYPEGYLHYAEIKISGDKIAIAVFTPAYSSHILCPGNFEIYVCDELSSYCEKLYFEYEVTYLDEVWSMSENLTSPYGFTSYMSGKLYYISPENGEKIELNLSE